MPEKMTIYRKNGETATMDSIDARRTVQAHGDDWATKPWPKQAEQTKAPEPPKAAEKYEAKHRGGGSYSIVDAAGNEVMEKLSKEDAEAFNGMTAEEKAAYVQADSAKG